MKSKIITSASLLAFGLSAMAQVVHYDMTVNGGRITESVSKKQFAVNSQLPAFSVSSIDGEAMRFDGYSNFVDAEVPATEFSTEALTISVLLAAETYPMMNTSEAEITPTFGMVCGNLDEASKTGFALELSSQGDLRFRYGSANGFLYTLKSSSKLPRGQWNRLTVVLDKSSNKSYFYLNGEQVGASSMAGIKTGNSQFFIGKNNKQLTGFGANINTFCGLIDDIVIYNEAFSAEKVTAMNVNTKDRPDFNYPDSRYSEGVAALWRPQFHGMPSGGWTNESHGLTYSDGRYHVFFQKNANGPYMARLHWGHISSENLCSWTEEPIAFGPSEAYDIKGCWSGCVFDDGIVTGGKTGALYTAVDNAKATICLATADDQTLADWTKATDNPLVNGRPQGLSDDFRDPYFFTANGHKYIIVGTSKNNLGACTLHKYNNGTWSNDGTIFFQATNASQHGTFWEMPNVTDMGNGKWLFTCTPIGTGKGVRTLYWIGTISDDGKFIADNMTPQYLEMGGISKDGYGMLSPSIYQRDGRTILLGIVPDKLPTEKNLEMGWAHNYSLPREIRLSDDGKNLWQKPCSELTAMRSSVVFSQAMELSGTQSLSPVAGRQIELEGNFTVGTTEFGFSFFKSGDQAARLSYNPNTNVMKLDLTSLSRQVNDGSYNGIYSTALPEKPTQGSLLNVHVYVDGSIADIFVDNKWAYSVRIFPLDSNSTNVEVFGNTNAEVNAWVLDPKNTSAIENITFEGSSSSLSSVSYNILGQKVNTTSKGIIITNGKKYVRH